RNEGASSRDQNKLSPQPEQQNNHEQARATPFDLNASHMTRLRAGVKIFFSRSLILKFSSCSFTTTAQLNSSSAFVVMSERRSIIFGKQKERTFRIFHRVNDV